MSLLHQSPLQTLYPLWVQLMCLYVHECGHSMRYTQPISSHNPKEKWLSLPQQPPTVNSSSPRAGPQNPFLTHAGLILCKYSQVTTDVMSFVSNSDAILRRQHFTAHLPSSCSLCSFFCNASWDLGGGFTAINAPSMHKHSQSLVLGMVSGFQCLSINHCPLQKDTFQTNVLSFSKPLAFTNRCTGTEGSRVGFSITILSHYILLSRIKYPEDSPWSDC